MERSLHSTIAHVFLLKHTTVWVRRLSATNHAWCYCVKENSKLSWSAYGRPRVRLSLSQARPIAGRAHQFLIRPSSIIRDDEARDDCFDSEPFFHRWRARSSDTMPTNRPFFANFFSAFRARTNPTFQAKSSSAYDAVTPGSLVASAHVSTTTATVTSSGTRTITTKSTGDASASSQPSQNKASSTSPLPFSSNTNSHRYAAPLSRSPGPSSPGGPHSHSHSHTNTNLSMSPPGASTPLTRGRQRRGSDSSNSSGGFIDALGPEKWYIGGRNAAGEETFYKLGLVTSSTGKRVRSLDRLSL